MLVGICIARRSYDVHILNTQARIRTCARIHAAMNAKRKKITPKDEEKTERGADDDDDDDGGTHKHKWQKNQ